MYLILHQPSKFVAVPIHLLLLLFFLCTKIYTIKIFQNGPKYKHSPMRSLAPAATPSFFCSRLMSRLGHTLHKFDLCQCNNCIKAIRFRNVSFSISRNGYINPIMAGKGRATNAPSTSLGFYFLRKFGHGSGEFLSRNR